MQKNGMKEILASLATEIKSAAKSSKEEADRSWPSSSSSDREMRKMASRDAKDIRDIASLVARGRVVDAYDKAYGLDTLVRETVPDRFWKFAESVIRHGSESSAAVRS
jgi:hypothetical protein